MTDVKNNVKTVVLMTVLTVILILIGRLIGGRSGMMVFFGFAVLMNFFSYWFSDKIVLAIYRARPVTREEAPELYDVVSRLAERDGLPMPRLYVIPQDVPNAFATGRDPNHAAVAVTSGLMELLDREELSGVIGHELSHVKNRDILIGTVAATIAGAIMMIADAIRWTAMFGGLSSRDDEDRGGGIALLVLAIIAPIAAMLIQMAISRSREYIADEGGAVLTGKPRSLARALRKLDEFSRKGRMAASPSTAHMFIVNPLSGKSLFTLFSTHPAIEDRIKRLEEMQL